MSIIFNPNYNDQAQQVEQNRQDIKKLKEIVGQVYSTPLESEIPDGSTTWGEPWTVSLSDTDLPQDIELGTDNGYLVISADSKLFKLINVRYDANLNETVCDLLYICDIQGRDGEQGADGQNATSISLGTVTSGNTASATLTPAGGGDYVLDLVLPKGDTGATGETGANGLNAVISGVTATIDSGIGTPDIDVEMSGTPQDRTFNFDFHNLKGEKGDDAVSLSVGTVTTETAGTPASASLTSDGNGNYELNLGIPQGANGTNGVDGKGFEYTGKIVQASDWEVNTGLNPTTPTYYPYRAFIPITGLNSQSIATVFFDAYDIESFTLAPYCTFATVNDTGGVYIFTTDNTRTVTAKVLYYIAEVI